MRGEDEEGDGPIELGDDFNGPGKPVHVVGQGGARLGDDIRLEVEDRVVDVASVLVEGANTVVLEVGGRARVELRARSDKREERSLERTWYSKRKGPRISTISASSSSRFPPSISPPIKGRAIWKPIWGK